MKRLTKKKPIHGLISEAESHGLHRALGASHLTALGVGGIIGAGIFVLTGNAAATCAGPAIVLSFIISAVGCAFAGLCYAEFASMIPVAGSAYTYAYATLGEIFAWIIGWDLILEYLFGAATVAVGWSGYVVSFLKDFGIVVPPELMSAYGTKLINIPAETLQGLQQAAGRLPGAGWQVQSAELLKTLKELNVDYTSFTQCTSYFNLPASLIVLLVTTLLVIGIRESARFNNIIVFVKIAVILLFIGFGIAYFRMDNVTPFIPENTGKFGQFGISGILRGAGIIFFAYIGFDAVSTAAQEARNPQKDMPVGILGSLLICTVLYIAISLVMTGMVSYTHLNVAHPIAVAIDAAGQGLFWLRPLIKIGAIAGLSSVVLVLMLGQSRVFYSMAKDGLLPEVFDKIHPRFKTPYVTTIVTGIFAMLFSGFFPIGLLGELVSIGTLLAFVIVCAGVIVLRRTRPELQRPFRVPLVPLVPILGVVVCMAQMVSLPVDTWLRLAIWMAAGLFIYFLYSRHHSKVVHEQHPEGIDDKPPF